MSLVDSVDASVAAAVLVFGSLPPEGRDLDLLVRPAEQEAIAARLEREGFASRGEQWVRFRGCAAESVDLVPAASWALPPAELEALFLAAKPIDGSMHLLRPAPEHALLVFAKRLGRRPRGLDEKWRAHIARALAEEPDAWRLARGRAPSWGLQAAIARLEAAYRAGPRTPSRRGLVRRPRRGSVISLSGLDGAGKSSQAAALRDTLDQLGFDAVVEWIPLGSNPSLQLLSRPAKRVLRRLPLGEVARKSAAGDSLFADPGATARPGGAAGRLVLHLWATTVALTSAAAQRRASGRHLRRGRIVIFDRYTLDSAVRLRFLYGERAAFHLQSWLIWRLSPQPLRSYLLDVSPETALARKQDLWTLDQLRRQAELYREEQQRFAVRRLDGERPRDELCAEIAADVWQALGR